MIQDFQNAFNTIGRTAIFYGLEQVCPELLILCTALYCGETQPEMRAELCKSHGATADTAYIVQSQTGVQQGDSCGSMWYAAGMTWALHQGGTPPKHAAYLDDLHFFLDAGFTE